MEPFKRQQITENGTPEQAWKKNKPSLEVCFHVPLGKMLLPKTSQNWGSYKPRTKYLVCGPPLYLPPKSLAFHVFLSHSSYPVLRTYDFLGKEGVEWKRQTGAVKMMWQLLWWALTFLPRTRVQFPARTWWLTTCDKSSSGESDTLFWPPYVLHACSTQI